MMIDNFDRTQRIRLTKEIKTVIRNLENALELTYHTLNYGEYLLIYMCIEEECEGKSKRTKISVTGYLNGWLNKKEYYYSDRASLKAYQTLMGHWAEAREGEDGRKFIFLNFNGYTFYWRLTDYWLDVCNEWYEYLEEKGIEEPNEDPAFGEFYNEYEKSSEEYRKYHNTCCKRG